MTRHLLCVSRGLVFMAYSVCALCSGFVAAAEDGELLDIEQRCIDFRQSLRSGQMEIRSIVTFHDGGVREGTYTVYFERDKSRIDRDERRYGVDETPLKGMRRVAAWGNDAFRLFTEEKTDDGGQLISVIANRSSNRADIERFADPRLLGMYPTTFSNLIYYKLNSRITDRSGVRGVDLQTETLDGRDVYRITYREEWGRDVVTISPTQNYNVTRIERLGRDGIPNQILDVMLNVVEGVGWFPAEVLYTQFGKSGVEKSERLTINVKQLNKPLAEETWSFRGMGASIGHMIVNMENGEQIALDEDDVKLTDVGTGQIGVSDISAGWGGWSSSLLYFNGVFCVALAAFFTYRWWVASSIAAK